jgi:hypothetical protein
MIRTLLLVVIGLAVIGVVVGCGKGDRGKRTDVPLVTNETNADKTARKTKSIEAGIPDPTPPKR